MPELWLPVRVERTVPDWFRLQLRSVDPSLIVYFNPIRNRWVIDRCTLGGMGHVSDHAHTAECPKTNVFWVQGEAGEYMPLCDAVISKLRSMDAWSKFGSWENMTRLAENKEADQKEAIQQEMKDDIKHASRDGRVQMNKMVHLIQQHDLRLNK
jgi:hypothetical protein